MAGRIVQRNRRNYNAPQTILGCRPDQVVLPLSANVVTQLPFNPATGIRVCHWCISSPQACIRRSANEACGPCSTQRRRCCTASGNAIRRGRQNRNAGNNNVDDDDDDDEIPADLMSMQERERSENALDDAYALAEAFSKLWRQSLRKSGATVRCTVDATGNSAVAVQYQSTRAGVPIPIVVADGANIPDDNAAEVWTNINQSGIVDILQRYPRQ